MKIGSKLEQAGLISIVKANGSKANTWFAAGFKSITAWLISKPPSMAPFFACLEVLMKTKHVA